jgi:hypothetical protein
MKSGRSKAARALRLAALLGCGLPLAVRGQEQAPAKTAGGAPPKAAQPGAAGSTKGKPATAFKEEELIQLTAPIALYTDDLVSQILMASTYPIEVIEAHRFAESQKNLKGDALAKALEAKTWDPSVKSLVQFPSVLKMMNDKLDWMQKLGDAFLAQQKEVMATIQKLRAKAMEEGNLKSTKEQKVTVEEPGAAATTESSTTVIKIESSQPDVIYVPTYNPTVVYGTWPYPSYPPYYYTPPGYVAAASMVSFGIGVACGAAWGYAWGGCNWGGGEVDIDIDKNVNFNQNINRESYKNRQGTNAAGKGTFQHDASHRKGAGYRDQATAQKYGRGASASTTQARESYRGRAEQGRQNLSSPSSRDAANRSVSASDRAGGAGGNRASARSTGASSGRSGGASASSRQSGGGSSRSSAFQGSGSGRQASSYSSRGSSSRSSVSRSSGGGGRSGGGRRGGGGRR